MKIHICYNVTNSPHGGGNQFIRALKKQFIGRDLYTNNPESADIILFNSHQNVNEVCQIKNIWPSKLFIHRVDGPMRLYNDMSDTRDDLAYLLNDRIATATIFQSAWSKEKNISMGMKDNKPNTVIINSVNSDIFNEDYKKSPTEKVRCISTSFSSNYKKGHKYYEYLDSNLDFDRFEYVFLGNSPVQYKNIKLAGCLDTHGVAEQLKNSDLYITASENDPCSNSLLEAISCGLKVLALDSGGHTEIINNPDNVFIDEHAMLKKILNYDKISKIKNIKKMNETVDLYLNFFKRVRNAIN
jgi:glycosyltransferase involved in cell wall biosynthesis